MVELEQLKSFLEELNEERVWYSVMGGFAVEGSRGKITRKHKDIDLLVKEVETAQILYSLHEKGYDCFQNGRIYMAEKQKLRAEFMILSTEGNYFVLDGNKAYEKYPIEIFEETNYGIIEGYKFPIIPNEIFVKNADYFKHEADKAHAKTLECNIELMNRIETRVLPKEEKFLVNLF